MYLLKMSGYPITNIRDYRRYFNLYDILKQKKEFLSFSLSHFANLSKSDRYCAAMVYVVVENRVPIFMRESMDETKDEIVFRTADVDNFWNNPFAFCQTCTPCAEALELSDELQQQFSSLTGDIIHRKALFLSIAAFTFLKAAPGDVKIDTDRVKKSFLGQENRIPSNGFALCFEDDGTDCIHTITLDPSDHVYVCAPYDGGDFQRIKTYRIAAGRRIGSLSHRTVRICAGETELVIPAGEHVYVNTVNGQFASVFEKSRSKKGHTLRNTGTGTDILQFDKEHEIAFYGNDYISSFDFYEGDLSILYLNNLKLCFDRCLSPALKEQLEAYADLNLTEVKLAYGHFYLLKTDGEMLSSDPGFSGKKNVFSIDSLLRSYLQ